MSSDLLVVMLSTDRAIARASRARERMRSYAQRVGSLTVVVPGSENATREDSALALRTVAGPFASIRYAIAAIREARSASRKGPTVVTAQDPFEIGLAGLLASRIAGAPLHAQVHIDFYDPHFKRESLRQRVQSLIAPFVLRRARGIRCVSPRIRDYLVNGLGIPVNRVQYLPIAADTDALLAREPHASASRIAEQEGWDCAILAASRFVPQKNIPLLVRAFARAASTRLKLGLVIIGEGKEGSAIEAIVRDSDVADRIRIEPWAENLSDRIAAADIFALSSDYEGWGMTAVEAAALGTPVVMTDVGCADAVIRDGETGLVVPTRDIEAFARALGQLADDASLRARLTANAKEAVRSLVSGDAYDAEVISGWAAAYNPK